jgi:hypothetical protein
MKRLVMTLLMGLFCMSNESYAGNGDLSVGGTLEMTSSANGFLPPRMTTSARGNLTPSPGMLIYNTDDNAYNYYAGSGWKNLAAGFPVRDNTGASVDYPLAVNETAKITYSATTSVPLHIATVSPGEYELIIMGNRSVSVLNNNGAFLSPNNTTVSNITNTYFIFNNCSTSATGSTTTATTFSIMAGRIDVAKLNISTYTVSKSMIGTLSGALTGTVSLNSYITNQLWYDTTTAWTSLGTITFPFAQSGTIIIRRIL